MGNQLTHEWADGNSVTSPVSRKQQWHYSKKSPLSTDWERDGCSIYIISSSNHTVTPILSKQTRLAFISVATAGEEKFKSRCLF